MIFWTTGKMKPICFKLCMYILKQFFENWFHFSSCSKETINQLLSWSNFSLIDSNRIYSLKFCFAWLKTLKLAGRQFYFRTLWVRVCARPPWKKIHFQCGLKFWGHTHTQLENKTDVQLALMFWASQNKLRGRKIWFESNNQKLLRNMAVSFKTKFWKLI